MTTATATETTATLAASILAHAEEHGIVKFQPTDVLDSGVAAAERYLSLYEGSFEFLLDVRSSYRRRGSLTVGQAKGVLNCALAEARRNRDAATVVETGPAPEGIHYLDGRYVRVQTSKTGNRYGKVWTGEGWDYAPGATKGLSDETVVDAETAAAFGLATGRCVFCSRKLSTDESLSVGYGPDCAADRGLPWGDVNPDVVAAKATVATVAPVEAFACPDGTCGDCDNEGACDLAYAAWERAGEAARS